MGSRLRQDVKHFFECFCEVVGPKEDSGAWIIQKYPESYKDESVLKSVPEFAFPCEIDKTVPQHFSFVCTDSISKWTFGFCRHDIRSETVLVVLTYLPWHEAFSKFLNDIAQLMQRPYDNYLWPFLDFVYKSKIPTLGNDISVLVHPTINVFKYEAPSQFKLPSIPENRNLTEYYNAVDNHNMMVIFASMLFERRIIFTSKKLSRLSACVQSANALLYPMSWQHIFIPVLPYSMIDYLQAPMPYLIGLPHSLITSMKRNEVGDVVILEADNNSVETPFQDLESLPPDVIHNLQKQLRNRGSLLGDGVSRAFLRALVQLIGGYRDALKISQGKRITFNEEAFVESRPTSIQPFLRKMLELQIFRQFIEERLDLLNAGLGFSDEFEVEVCNYSDKSSSKLQRYKERVHNMKREGTAILKTVKNKANPAVKAAVKTMNARSKDVSSAYKGIRSKLKDTKKSKSLSAPSSPTADRAHGSMLESKLNSSSSKGERSQFQPLENGPVATSVSSDDLSPPKLNQIDLMDDLHDVIFRNLHTESDENDNTAGFHRSKLPVGRKLDSHMLKSRSATFESFSSAQSRSSGSADDLFKSSYKVLPSSRSENSEDEPQDLIRLDSSSSIGDFDPLTNGDSFHSSSPIHSGNSSLSPTHGVTNPLYPYYATSKKPQQALKDSELLNEYGINFDKLSISSSNANMDGASCKVARSKSEWTKFD